MITAIKHSILLKVISIVLAFNILGISAISANDKIILNSGTSVIMETTQPIKSEVVKAGYTLYFKVLYDVKVNDKIVIPAGSRATGQVVRSEMAKGLGKPGAVEVQVNSVEALDGQVIPLVGGNLYQAGDDNQTEAILLGVLLCILFLTIKGDNAVIPSGTMITAATAGTYYIAVE